jgi:hypothetical protein
LRPLGVSSPSQPMRGRVGGGLHRLAARTAPVATRQTFGTCNRAAQLAQVTKSMSNSFERCVVHATGNTAETIEEMMAGCVGKAEEDRFSASDPVPRRWLSPGLLLASLLRALVARSLVVIVAVLAVFGPQEAHGRRARPARVARAGGAAAVLGFRQFRGPGGALEGSQPRRGSQQSSSATRNASP